MVFVHRGSGLALCRVGMKDGALVWRARPAGSTHQYAEFTTVPDMPIRGAFIIAFLALRATG
jgi:hypothetical protein